MRGVSVRLAFVAIAVLGVGMAVLNGTRTHGEAPQMKGSARSEAIEAITRMGGTFAIRYEGSPEFMALVKRLGYDERSYYDILQVNLYPGKVHATLGDADLEALAGHLTLFTHLEVLDLRGYPFTARGVAALPPLPKLTVLRLDGMAVTDDIIDELPKFPALSSLELEGTAVTEAGIEKLRRVLPACKVRR